MKQGRNQPRKQADQVSEGRPDRSDLVALNSVTCRNFEEHIHVLLDTRAPLLGDVLIQRHAAECSPCAAILADYESLDDSVSKISIADLSKIAGVDLTQVPAIPAAKSRFAEMSRAVFGATAIAVMLAAAIGIGLTQGTGSVDRMQVADLNHASAPAEPTYPESSTNADSEFELTSPVVASSASLISESLPSHSDDFIDSRDNRYRLPEIRKAALLVAFNQSDVDAMEPLFNPLETMRAKNAESWQRLTERLDPISPYLRMSAELPGIRSIHDSLNITVNLIQQSFSQPQPLNEPMDVSSKLLRAATA